MSIQNALASLAVKDLDEAASWYEALFGRAADSRPMPGVAEWNFPRGGWLQVYALAARAGQGSLTLAVDDIDAQAAMLEAMGVDTSQRSNNDKVRTIMVVDPDGNHIAFAQALDPTLAR